MGLPAVRGDRARRGHLRPGDGRLEGQHPRPRRCASCVGWAAPGRGQAAHRGSGRGWEPARGRLPRRESGSIPRGRDPRRRRWLDSRRGAVSDRLAARRRPHHRRGADACEQQALGPVRRRGPRRARRARPCDRVALGCERRCRRGGAPPRGVDGRVLHRGRVPAARRGRGRHADRRDWRDRLQDLERPCGHGAGHRLPPRRGRSCLRPVICPRGAQRARSPGTARRRGAGGRDAAPRGAAPVRRAARSDGRRDRRRLSCELEWPGVGRHGRRDERGLGHADRRRRSRGSSSRAR